MPVRHAACAIWKGSTMDANRRDVLKLGGVVTLGGAVAGCATATGINPVVPPLAKVVQDPSQTQPTPVTIGAGTGAATQPREKQTYVPQARDPLAYSIADNLFWNDIMMEHAMF